MKPVESSRIQSELINAAGRPLLGMIDRPLARVNYMDYDLRTVMDKPKSRWQRYLGFNQFQFIGLSGPDFIAGVALVDLKLVGNLFAYVFDFSTEILEEFSCLLPGSLGLSLPITPDEGEARGRWRQSRFCVTADAATRSRKLKVEVPGRLEFAALLRETPGFKPLRVCATAGYNGWVYTQKAAGLMVQGSLQTPRRRFELDANCRASYDWSCGFMRRETAWNWASLSTLLPDGRSLGLNLAAGVNETGVTENVFWLDQRLHKLDMAVFEFDRYNPDTPWRVRSSDGKVDLHFEPVGCRREKVNVWLLASNFRQFFGYYSGEIRGSGGERIYLDRVPGFAEDHYAKW